MRRPCAMSTDQSSMDVSFLEKIGDKLSAFSEGIANFITRLLGSSYERYVRKLGYVRNRDGSHTVTPGLLLAKVNALEPKMHDLAPEHLMGLTPKFRER